MTESNPPDALSALVRAEIEALHGEFEAWFRGESESLERVAAALDDDFILVTTHGNIVTAGDVLTGLGGARGSRQLSIRTERSQVRYHDSATVVATYEEWHSHANYTTTRQSTVVFALDEAAPGGLKWRLVHESWITPPPTWVVPPPAGASTRT